MKPYAIWTYDCQGKQDFDGPILSVSTRYWPGPSVGGTMVFDSATGEFSTAPYGSRPSASAAIILNLGPAKENDGGGDYRVWRRADFEADSEAEVKAQVETWAAAQMREIVSLLGGLPAFQEDA